MTETKKVFGVNTGRIAGGQDVNDERGKLKDGFLVGRRLGQNYRQWGR